MAKGLALVAVVATVAFLGVHLWAGIESERWREERLDVARENAAQAGALGGPIDDPEEPIVARHTGWIASGAALVVAVVGTIIVLLFVIATRRG